MVKTLLDISNRLCVLAERLEAEWKKLAPLRNLDPITKEYQTDKHRRMRMLWGYAVTAGEMLLQAINQGAFADGESVRKIVAKMGPPGDDGHKNAVFLGLWQNWLRKRHPNYLFDHNGLGYAYADAIRLFAHEIDSTPGKAQTVEDQVIENSDIPDPDEKLVLEIKGKGRAILRYLWKRGSVRREELRQAIWKKQSIKDRGIDKAIDDLNLKLTQIIGTGCKTKVVRSGGEYLLQHPQK